MGSISDRCAALASLCMTHNSENTSAENTAGLGNMSLTDAHGTDNTGDAGNMNTSGTMNTSDAHDADKTGESEAAVGCRVRQDMGMGREGSATWAQ